eukprot:2139672-Ditylum_brightwellii.AAC.1
MRYKDRDVDKGSDKGKDIVVFDTGGGRNSMIRARAWHIFERMNHHQEIHGYENDDGGKVYRIVNAATKAYIPGRDMPIHLVLYYATLNEDWQENESLIVPFEMMKHGIHVDLMPQCFRGKDAIEVDEEHLPFEWDNEKLFWKISKQTKEELKSLETFELNSPLHDMSFKSRTC